MLNEKCMCWCFVDYWFGKCTVKHWNYRKYLYYLPSTKHNCTSAEFIFKLNTSVSGSQAKDRRLSPTRKTVKVKWKLFSKYQYMVGHLIVMGEVRIDLIIQYDFFASVWRLRSRIGGCKSWQMSAEISGGYVASILMVETHPIILIINTLRTGAFKLFKCTFPGFKQFQSTFILCFFKYLYKIR